MKRLYVIFLSFLAVFVVSCGCNDSGRQNGKDSLHTTISMSGAFALYPMAVRWAEEYHKLNPNITFDVQAGGAGKGMADALSGMIDCGMVSRSISQEELSRGAWPMTVARDAVVPTCHAENPYATLLTSHGVTRKQFSDIWIGGSIKTWGRLLGNSSPERIHVFTRSDAAGAPETWARYLGSHQENLQGIGVFGDPGVHQSQK